MSNLTAQERRAERAGVPAKRNSALRNFRLDDPLLPEINDARELQLVYSKYPLIPWAGTQLDSQDTMLRFVDNVYDLSPTLGGTGNNIGLFSFGGKTNIKKIVNRHFDIVDQQGKVVTSNNYVDPALQMRFIDYLDGFDLSGYDWSSIKMSLYTSLKKNGNLWLEVRVIKGALGAAGKTILVPHKQRHCRYVVPDLFQTHMCWVSKQWDDMYLQKYPPLQIPVYPAYQEYADGSVRTMIHVKLGDNQWYGRPDWWRCIFNAFEEIKISEYGLTAAHNMFTGKFILEYEGKPNTETATNKNAAQDAGYETAEEQWARNFTNLGENPQSVLVAQRPFGSRPMYTKEVALNMNENYYKTKDEINTDKILLVNQWSRKLNGISMNDGFGGTGFVDDLKTRLSIIEYWENHVDNNALNKAINFAMQMQGITEFQGLGIESKNPFDHLLNAEQQVNAAG